ncbi:uncharacterized protein LOC131880546 isoform X2 [Tigriopus californicus]|uniref:uncharacterized protein LOC131880546 isoform X2 n=1 Tax=Tigriopus californicus TaxID=6832 RepID=UPI0027DA49D2|nr:uncharacterized protein LOC131880546 isoform X2 [Tigriopus californicus]
MSDLHVEPVFVHDFERLLLDLGTWGLYQTIMSLLLFIPIVFVSSIVFFNLIELSSGNSDANSAELTKDWSRLVFLGGMVVSLVMTFFLARIVGRKYTFLTAVTCLGSCGIWISFSSSQPIILGSKFICGLGCVGIVYSAILLQLEIVGTKYSHVTGLLLILALALGQVYLGFTLSHVEQNDQMVWCWTCGPILAFLLNWLILPHSYRWLIATAQMDEAQDQMNRMAKWNNQPFRSIMEYTQPLPNQSAEVQHMWQHFTVYSGCSFTCGALIFAIVHNVPEVTGSIGMDLGILAISDILAIFLDLAFGSNRGIEFLCALFILASGSLWLAFRTTFDTTSWSFVLLFLSRISLALTQINQIELVGQFPVDDLYFLLCLSFGELGVGFSAAIHIFLSQNVEAVFIGTVCFVSAVSICLLSFKNAKLKYKKYLVF